MSRIKSDENRKKNLQENGTFHTRICMQSLRYTFKYTHYINI